MKEQTPRPLPQSNPSHKCIPITEKIFSAVGGLQHCEALWVNTVQPRQGQVKIARQELPGQQKNEGRSRQGRLIPRIFSRPCRDSVVPVFLPGSSCRAIFSRA